MQPQLLNLYASGPWTPPNSIEFMGFGAVEATNTYRCIRFGAMEATKPIFYSIWGRGGHQNLWFHIIRGPGGAASFSSIPNLSMKLKAQGKPHMPRIGVFVKAWKPFFGGGSG